MAAFIIQVTLFYTHNQQQKSKEVANRNIRKDDEFCWSAYSGKMSLTLSILDTIVDYGSTGHLDVSFLDTDNSDDVKTQTFPFTIPSEDSDIKGKLKTLTIHKGCKGVPNTTLQVRFRKTDVVFKLGFLGLGPHLEWYSEFQLFMKHQNFAVKLNDLKRKREALQRELVKLDEEETAIKKQKSDLDIVKL